jgi:CubicO group peptidase (beta-lactamase class C family)
MKQQFLIFLVSVFFVCTSACQNQKQKGLASFISNKADSLYKSEKLPGIFIGVLNNGERSYYSFGFADPDKKMPFDSSTLFEIGSITKTFTAYVLESVLKEKGIGDSSSIINYLPDSVKTNKALEKISFLNLLNHTSGLPRLPENMDIYKNVMAPYDNYKAVHLFSYLKTCIPQPDGKSNYSNLGAGLAGVLAERIAGKTYHTLLNQYIFTPFNITYHPDSSIASVANKAQGYFMSTGNKAVYWNADVLAPAGGLKCSASEMLTYLQAMAMPANEESKEIITDLLKPTASITPEIKVAKAWHTVEKEGLPVIYWHNGGTYGFSTFAGFLKDKNKAVIVIINQFNKNKISDGLGLAIMKELSK